MLIELLWKIKMEPKFKKDKLWKQRKNLFWVVSTTQFPQQVQQTMRRQYAQAANNHMMKIASSVDYIRSGGMRTDEDTMVMEHLYVTTAKFSGLVLLDSGSAYSYPPCRIRVRICYFFPYIP